MSLSLPLRHPSIEGFLRQQLSATIAREIPRLPIYRSRVTDGILYRCPLQYHFSPSQQADLYSALAAVNLILTSAGWLELWLDDRDLSDWLQYLWHSIEEFFPDSPLSDSKSEGSFLWQYTYARCGALLRLGTQAGLGIEGNEVLSCPQPVEYALILQLLTVVDRWDQGNPQRLAMNFCQSILDVDRFCRIIGEPIEVARWRLLAIAVSQRLLRALLTNKLQILPPEEL